MRSSSGTPVALLGLLALMGEAVGEPAWRLEAPCASDDALAGRLRSDGAIAVPLELRASEVSGGRWEAVIVDAASARGIARAIGSSCLEGDLADHDLAAPGVQPRCEVDVAVGYGTSSEARERLSPCGTGALPC